MAEGANWQSEEAERNEGIARKARRSTKACGDFAFVFGLGLKRTATTLRETERPINLARSGPAMPDLDGTPPLPRWCEPSRPP